VVRVAPNSPLKDEMMMGDIILKVNDYKIRQVEALQRICVISEGELTLDILREDTPMQIKVRLE
jgi:S1-C subfamily serine protease